MGKLKSVVELQHIINECEDALENADSLKKTEVNKLKNKLNRARADLQKITQEDNTGMR